MYWVLTCFAIAIVNGLERSLIGMAGENLTFNVRKELIRGMMYK
jgi:hypothetical protein